MNVIKQMLSKITDAFNGPLNY